MSAARAAEDRRLVDAFLRSGSEAAFRRLYRRHAERLYPLLRRLVGDPGEADELFQECWVRIVERLPTFAWRSSLATWMVGIAVNCAREWRRRGAGAHERADGDEAPAGGSFEDAMTAALDVEQALARLAPGYREVLLLHDVHGHTHEEIAELLSIAVGTSKSQLSRARRAARALLGEEST